MNLIDFNDKFNSYEELEPVDQVTQVQNQLNSMTLDDKAQLVEEMGVSRLTTLWQAVGNDDVFEVEVIDPKDEQRDIQEKDGKIEAKCQDSLLYGKQWAMTMYLRWR